LENLYGLSGSLTALIEADAVRAGERSRIMLEIKRGEDEDRRDEDQRSVRRRLATTLVQLGVKLDPEAADDLSDDA
jgi:hypothetical protein